ncbi:HAUS augmin-like complex subunit 6 isoform 3-T3 [Amazona ochrocephala]
MEPKWKERKWEGRHLWLYVLALGFERKTVNASRLVLGARQRPAWGKKAKEARRERAGIALQQRKMFNTPNIGALHVIATFLFKKQDPARAAVTFKNCDSVGPSFVKQCFIWLKDIEKKHRGCLQHVTSSALISPGGSRFIHMFYLFTKHVLVADMEKNYVGTGKLIAKAVKLRRKNMYMAKARCRIAYNKLLQIFLKEHFIIQEYQKKAWLLIKDKNRMNSEYAVLQIQSWKMKQNTENKNDKTERIQKIRSMWLLIMEMLTSLKKEKEVVDSVLDILENRVILDGTKVVVSVPQFLSYGVENDVYQHFTGTAHEAKSLNFLAVIQLLNEALRTLRDEHFQSELEKCLCVFENRRMRHKKSLQRLKVMRLEIEQQHRLSSESVSREQENWKVKWKSFLSLSPFYFILNQDRVRSLHQNLINWRERVKLTAFQHHSSRVAEEDQDFCQHLLSVSDVLDSITEESCQKDDGALETMMDKSTPPRISSVALEMSKASEYRDSLTVLDLHIETCKVEKTPLSTDILRNGKDEPAIPETGENAGYPVKNLLEKTRDELAEEVAEAVVSESTLTGERKGMALEDLISSLCFDPFITRKQIPRTPENLLTEVRRSWRKAIQTEDSSDIKLNLPEVTIEEAPVDAYACKKMADSRFECFDPASSVPDFDPALSESKSQLSSTEFRPQKQMRISHIESPVSEASEIQESERTEAHGLKYIVLNNSSVDDLEEHTSQYVKSIMNTTDVCSENTCGMNVLPSDRFQGSLTGRMLHQNISSLLNSVSDETAYLGILGETFEGCLEGEQLRGILGETFEGCLEGEQLSSRDANQSASFESDFVVMDSPYVAGGSKNEEGIERSKLDVQSLFNLHKALEKTPSTSEKELHQILNGGEPVSSVSSPSLAPEKRERDEFSSPQELFFLDEEFTKMPSPESLNEIKYSLSSLLASFQHLEETASMVHEIPLDLKQKLKDKEHLDEKPAMKELSSR